MFLALFWLIQPVLLVNTALFSVLTYGVTTKDRTHKIAIKMFFGMFALLNGLLLLSTLIG